jgi:hypothetical protein
MANFERLREAENHICRLTARSCLFASRNTERHETSQLQVHDVCLPKLWTWIGCKPLHVDAGQLMLRHILEEVNFLH